MCQGLSALCECCFYHLSMTLSFSCTMLTRFTFYNTTASMQVCIRRQLLKLEQQRGSPSSPCLHTMYMYIYMYLEHFCLLILLERNHFTSHNRCTIIKSKHIAYKWICFSLHMCAHNNVNLHCTCTLVGSIPSWHQMRPTLINDIKVITGYYRTSKIQPF